MSTPARDPDRRRRLLNIAALALALIVAFATWRSLGPAVGIRLLAALGITVAVVMLVLPRGRGEDEPDAASALPAGRQAEPLTLQWEAARQRHDRVLRAYLPYETDPVVVLTYPVLTDVSDEKSAAFFDALHDADVLRTDAQPGDDTAAAYIAAVAELARTWEVAEQNARQVAGSRLDQADRRTAQQCIKLLQHANEAASRDEQRAYAERAHALLSGLTARAVVRMPPRAMRAIESRRRRELD